MASSPHSSRSRPTTSTHTAKRDQPSAAKPAITTGASAGRLGSTSGAVAVVDGGDDVRPPETSRFGVVPWLDPEQDETGHDPRSAYVETFWLPIVGPSTTLLIRRLADEFDASPKGFELDARGLSREIGLGGRLDGRGSLGRTIDRAALFGLLQQEGDVLYVRRHIPRLNARQVGKLSERLQALHHSWTIDPADDGAQRRTELVRAAHLARTLLALGESTHNIETQLHQWHFHPSITWHAVQWAQTDPEQLP